MNYVPPYLTQFQKNGFFIHNIFAPSTDQFKEEKKNLWHNYIIHFAVQQATFTAPFEKSICAVCNSM